MPVNRDRSITDNLSPSGRVPSIADRENPYSAGAAARMNERDREREYCNLSDIERRREEYSNPQSSYGRPMSIAEPNMDWEIAHAARRQAGPGQSNFERGSILPQPPRDRER